MQLAIKFATRRVVHQLIVGCAIAGLLYLAIRLSGA